MSKILFLLGTLTLVFNPIRPILGFSISDLLYLCALVFLVLEALYDKEPLDRLMPWHSFWIPSLMILIGGLASTFISENIEISISETLKAWFMFSLWISLCISMVRDKNLIKYILIVFIAGVAFSSLIAVFDYLTGSEIGVALGGLPTTKDNRYSGTLIHPNFLGHFTGIAIPILVDINLTAFRLTSNGLYKILIAINSSFIFIILVWADILSGSNMGLFGLLIGLLLVLVVHSWKGDIVARFLIIFSGIFLLLIFINLISIAASDTNVFALISKNFDRGSEQTGAVRYQLAFEAFDLISESPILGYGMDQGGTGSQVNLLSNNVSGVHNSLLRAWIGGGILVFFSVTILYFKSMTLSIGAIMRNLKGQNIAYSVGLAAAAIGSVSNDMVNPSFLQRFSWFPIIILMGLLIQKPALEQKVN